MKTQFLGQDVVAIVRPASNKDQGFNPAAGSQQIIRIADGTEHIAFWSDLNYVAEAGDPHPASTQFQGQEVMVLRPATSHDHGFDKKLGPQTMIRLADGSQHAVLESDIKHIAEVKPAGSTGATGATGATAQANPRV